MNEKEKVVMIPISSIDDFPNHPFEVRDDEEMELLANSISSNGVLNPVILRANGERFEIIAGHRRKYACAKIGVAEVPAIVREMTREEAINYPECIIGFVSAIPDYDTWGPNETPVDGRIWIKIK